MSKRQGDVALADYRKNGYLQEAMVNFMALLGWNPKTAEEFFSLPELEKAFDLKQVNKAAAVFNFIKIISETRPITPQDIVINVN